MGLWDKIKGELVDVIEWTDPTSNTMVYRFERYHNEIKYGARLTVRESQVAVFVNEGKIADVYPPGLYTLETQNMPIMTTLNSWKHGFNSPFKAEVYFLNTKNFTDQKWGTKNPITLDDQRFGMLELRAFGTFATRVIEPKLFMKDVVGTDGNFTAEKIYEQLRSLAVTRFTDIVGESQIPVEKFAGNVDELSQMCQEKLDKEFAQYGLSVTKFVIENVSMPDEIKKEIFELSRLGRVNLDQLTKLKTAKAIETAAANPSGTAGAGMGMGMGFAMANQMGQAMAGSVGGAPAQVPAGGPPPIPGAVSYFVAVGGQQQGPFAAEALARMAKAGEISRDTLVWKQGMANWTAAGQVADLTPLFGAAPPPLPK